MIDGSASAGADLYVHNSGNVIIGNSSNVDEGKLQVFGDINIRNANGNNPTDAGSLYFGETGGVWGTSLYGFRINLNGSSNNLQIQGASTTFVKTIITMQRDTGLVTLGHNLTVSGAATFNSNIAVTGTVDGRDIAADGTQLDTNTSAISTNTSNISTNTSNISTNTSAIATKASASSVSTNTANIATNTSNISSNDTDIATNVTNIASNASSIQTNASNISSNSTDISTNASNISSNTSSISTNTSNISSNTSSISTNTSNISTNTSNISTNTSNISTNTSNISTNTSNISSNTTALATKANLSGAIFTGNVTVGSNNLTAAQIYVQGTYPRIYLSDTDSNDDYSIINNNGTFIIYNDTDSNIPFAIAGNGQATFTGNIIGTTANFTTSSGDNLIVIQTDDQGSTTDAGIHFKHQRTTAGSYSNCKIFMEQFQFYIEGDEDIIFRTNGVQRAKIKANGGLDVNDNITVGGTVDGIDIAARDAVLTSTTSTANTNATNISTNTTAISAKYQKVVIL